MGVEPMRKVVFCCGLALLISPSYAGDLSLFAGYSGPGDLALDATRVALSNHTLFGFRYEHRLASIFGVENSLAFTSDALSSRLSGDQPGLYYTGHFVLNVPIDGMLPNFAVGVGLLHRFGEGVPSLDTTFLVSYGVGLKLRRLVGPAGFRVDFRRFRYTDVQDESVTGNEISGGIVFTF